MFEDSNNGQTIRGVRPIEENPFDPKLTESDVSGFSFFRRETTGRLMMLSRWNSSSGIRPGEYKVRHAGVAPLRREERLGS